MIRVIFLTAELIVALGIIVVGGSVILGGFYWLFHQLRKILRNSLIHRKRVPMFDRILTFIADLLMIRCDKCKLEQGTNKDCAWCRTANPAIR